MRMELREVGWEVVGGIHLAQDRDHWRGPLNMVMDLMVT
jgi:hypothetical protein